MIKSFIKLVALGAFLMLLITPQVFAMGAGGGGGGAGAGGAGAGAGGTDPSSGAYSHSLYFTPTAWGRRKRSTRARRLTSNDRFDFKVALPIQLGAGRHAGRRRQSPHKIKMTA